VGDFFEDKYGSIWDLESGETLLGVMRRTI
jgi:hypothetical protein